MTAEALGFLSNLSLNVYTMSSGNSFFLNDRRSVWFLSNLSLIVYTMSSENNVFALRAI